MSVVDRNIIDFHYIEEKQVVLGICDYLPWYKATMAAHSEILNDKLEDYVDFIFSGQLKEKYPENYKSPCIKIFFLEPLNSTVEIYLYKMKNYFQELEIELIWEYYPVKTE